ncbi:mitochondrial inner membrane protease subunit 2 isoform X1 [Crotalus tigris]|uniref:mitochondrial inner membrane protease subunit 2 isoform X1 n=1 Tax=Crotalus tigris TaxID=88082 RepID=UPI00192F7B41|nr:mitochondrial inner membrane protease subunit 2 isoform X1 [Crotalus tigris]
MAQMQGFGRKYIKAFLKGFFVAVPVTVTFLDRVACIARVEGASMQPSLNPVEQQVSDIVLLNHWSIRNYKVQRGDIVSLVMWWQKNLTETEKCDGAGKQVSEKCLREMRAAGRWFFLRQIEQGL